MASYPELKDLQNDDENRNRVEVAIWNVFQEILVGDDTDPTFYEQTTAARDARVKWASANLGDYAVQAQIAWPLVLAANDSAPVSAITGADDSSYLNNVRELADELARGYDINNPAPSQTP